MNTPYVYALLILLGGILDSFGQSTYTLTGKVVDNDTNEPLIGATVMVENTSKGTNSRIDGTFVLKGIEDPQPTFKVSYIGYQTLTIEHDFSQGKNSNLIFYLQSGETTLGTVEIEGQAVGKAKAFLDQKNAINIKNVLSAEQIQAFPDMNAAEAMQRIPGITLQRDQGEGRFVQLRGTPPELTNFNINGEQIPSPEGDVRYVGLDVIAADQIEFIEVTKVLTPDMDADGIGGNVNIITKTAQGEEPDIRATFAGGYNNLRGTGNYQAQFTYGQRYGKFGFNVNASYYLNNQGSDNMEFKYAKGPFFGSQNLGVDNYQVQYREVQLRHYDITRSRIGISPSWDFKFNDKSFIYLRGMYNRFSDDETLRRVTYDLDDALSPTYYLYGGVEHDVRERTQIQDLATINLGGDHEFGRGVKIDYMIQYAYASESRPDHMEARFESPGQAIVIDFDVTDPQWPVAEYPKREDSALAFAYDRYELDELLFEESLVTDENIATRLNIQIPYTLNENNQGFIKFGGKYRTKDKERDIKSQVFGAYFEQTNLYPGVGPELSLLTVDAGFFDSNFLDQGYVLEYMPSPEKIREFYEFYPQHFIYDRTSTRVESFGEDYRALEDIYALYAMFRHDINNLTVLGGVRYERTDIDYEGVRIITDKGNYRDMEPLEDQRTHEFFLPQIQLKYNIDQNTNLRAAMTYTYARPNFEDVLPYREEDQDEVRFGNPNLEFPLSMNVDLLAEKYIPGGILSGGLFYKQIDDFIFYYKRFAHEGDPADYGLVEITKALNGLEAEVYGAEVQSQFNLTFLPGIFSNFGVYANYTYTQSRAFINRRFPANYSDAVVVFGEDDLSVFRSDTETEEIDLPGQAKHTANLALTYRDQKFYARLSANFSDEFLDQLGADEDLDEYYGQAWRVDFTANYAITPNVKAFIDLINLTNAPLTYYLGTPDRIQQQEFYSWWGRVGVKLNF